MHFSSAILIAGLSTIAAATPFGVQGFQGYNPFNPVAYKPTTTSAAHTTTTHTTSSTTAAMTTPAMVYPSICLTNSTASNLVNQFASLLTNYNNATANAVLSSTFTDTSDSINFLAGYPLGGATFPSKAAFEAGQGSQPAIGFNVLNIDAVTCNVVAFRWSAAVGGTLPVKGINVMYASNTNGTDGGWQIAKMFSEFNSAAWVADLPGGQCGVSQTTTTTTAAQPSETA